MRGGREARAGRGAAAVIAAARHRDDHDEQDERLG
jgi:hypothetical protein